MKGQTRNSRVRTPAERQRDRRARRRRGEVVFPIALPEEAVRDILIETGRLKEWDDDDRQRLTEALGDLFRDYVTRDG